MKRSTKAVVTAVATVTLLGASISPASAAGEGGASISVASNEARASLVASPSEATFSTDDVLQFLVFGDGAVEKANPGLAASLGFVPFPADGDREAADALIAAYATAEPRTAAQVSKSAQSGDPVLVEAGLALFAESFNQFVLDLYDEAAVELKASGQQMQSGWVWTETWAVAATVVAGGAVAVVFAAVAGFHVGAAVTVIVAVYLPGMEDVSALDRDNLVSKMTAALD